jgi:hypothetical protein
VRAGRPHGIEAVERDAESEDEAPPIAAGADPRPSSDAHVPTGERRWSRSPFDWRASVRLRVRVRRFSLDQQVARGADPRSNAALAERARELCRPELRRALAGELERVLEAAKLPGYWLVAPLNRSAIAECRPLLLDLVQDLGSTGPVHARGVALVRLLLRDGRSPIYAPSPSPNLEEELRRARAALLLE